MVSGAGGSELVRSMWVSAASSALVSWNEKTKQAMLTFRDPKSLPSSSDSDVICVCSVGMMYSKPEVVLEKQKTTWVRG